MESAELPTFDVNGHLTDTDHPAGRPTDQRPRLLVQQPRRLVGYRSKALLSLTSDVQQIFPTMSFLWSKAPPCAPDSHVCRGAAGGRRPACASGTRAGAVGKPVPAIGKNQENAPCHPYD